MDAKMIMKEFLDTAKALTVTNESRKKVVDIFLSELNIKIDPELNLLSNVSDETLSRLPNAMKKVPVLKIAARRILRNNGISVG